MIIEADCIQSCKPRLNPHAIVQLDLDMALHHKINIVYRIWEDLGTELFNEKILIPEGYKMVKI